MKNTKQKIKQLVKRWFGKRDYIDLQTIKRLKEKGIKPFFSYSKLYNINNEQGFKLLSVL